MKLNILAFASMLLSVAMGSHPANHTVTEQVVIREGDVLITMDKLEEPKKGSFYDLYSGSRIQVVE